MKEPKFNNRENELMIIITGTLTGRREIYDSRSVAIHGILIVRKDDIDYLLLTKRSENCPDEIGKFANVTGYLDWDESGIEALKREYWEETKLFFDKVFNAKNLIYGNLEQPFSVQTNPTANRQNVTLRYGFAFEVDELPNVGKTIETSEVSFIPVADVLTMIDNNKTQFAWDHSDRIEEFINDMYSEQTLEK